MKEREGARGEKAGLDASSGLFDDAVRDELSPVLAEQEEQS